MIGLIAQAIRARPVQAVVLALLSFLATTAALAGPVYLTAADRAIVVRAVAAAPPVQRSIEAHTRQDIGADNRVTSLDDFGQSVGPSLVAPGFTEVLSGEMLVMSLDLKTDLGNNLVYRQDACAHVEIGAGRCPAGANEIMLSDDVATTLHLAPGTTVTIAAAQPDPLTKGVLLVPAGRPTTLTVTGVYHVINPADAYWGERAYFGVPGAYPIFADAITFESIDRPVETDSVDSIGPAAAFAPDRLPTLRARVAAISQAQLSAGTTMSTAIPQLFADVDRARAAVHPLVPMAGIPVALLALVVLFLVVGYGAQARRAELGMVALRGVRRGTRWWLACGESLTAITAGCLAGYLAGPAIVAGLTAWHLAVAADRRGATAFALGTWAVALGLAVLGHVSELTSPVATLMRRVPSRVRQWRGATVEVVVAMLALTAGVQLRLGGRLSGLAVLAPGLVAFGIALLAARAVVPIANRYGASAMQAGRVGPAMAALHLGRRPGASRVFALVVVAVGLLAFDAAGFDVGATARADRAEITLGAPTVVQVSDVNAATLLAAVREVDPQHRFAMAVAILPGLQGGPSVLAVDSQALPASALWRGDYGALDAAAVAARLRPPADEPVTFSGTGVALDVVASSLPADTVSVVVAAAPLDGSPVQEVNLGYLHVGDHVYQHDMADCQAGCRLIRLSIGAANQAAAPPPVVLRSLRSTGPDHEVVDAAGFATPGAWHAVGTQAGPVAGGLSVTPAMGVLVGTQGSLYPRDAAYPLPAVSTVGLASSAQVTGVDGDPVDVAQVAQVTGLPGLGNDGIIVDLQQAQKLAVSGGALPAQVWLGPDAPSDAVARLTAAGLSANQVTRVADLRAQLERQGPALATWFYLVAAAVAVAVAAGAIALVGAVDRARRAEDLAALRVQGLPPATTAMAGYGGSLTVVLAALPVGLVAGAAAWLLAGGALPVFVDRWSLWPRPLWPQLPWVAGPWLAAGALLATVAGLAAFDLHRTVGRMVSSRRSR